MCIKAGNNELGTVKALMAMSLNSIIADVFDLDLDDIAPYQKLRTDLHMDAARQSELADLIAEYFDGLLLDFSQIQTVDDLFNVVVENEFRCIPEEAWAM